MTTCVMCSKPVENSASTGVVCRSCFDAEQTTSNTARTSFLSKVPIALFVALLPFIVSFRTSSSSTETDNGVTTISGTSTDYIAVALGPLAILLGLIALVGARTKPEGERMKPAGLAALAIVIGAYQLYRGLH